MWSYFTKYGYPLVIPFSTDNQLGLSARSNSNFNSPQKSALGYEPLSSTDVLKAGISWFPLCNKSAGNRLMFYWEIVAERQSSKNYRSNLNLLESFAGSVFTNAYNLRLVLKNKYFLELMSFGLCFTWRPSGRITQVVGNSSTKLSAKLLFLYKFQVIV